jgi:hypothetical protein
MTARAAGRRSWSSSSTVTSPRFGDVVSGAKLAPGKRSRIGLVVKWAVAEELQFTEDVVSRRWAGVVSLEPKLTWVFLPGVRSLRADL